MTHYVLESTREEGRGKEKGIYVFIHELKDPCMAHEQFFRKLFNPFTAHELFLEHYLTPLWLMNILFLGLA